MRNMKPTETEKQEAIAKLRKLAPKGTTIYGIVREVSSSGMSRTIDFYVLKRTRSSVEPVWITPWFRYLTGWRPEKHDRGLVVRGAGMDMILHAVSSVAHTVHGDDYAWLHGSL